MALLRSGTYLQCLSYKSWISPKTFWQGQSLDPYPNQICQPCVSWSYLFQNPRTIWLWYLLASQVAESSFPISLKHHHYDWSEYTFILASQVVDYIGSFRQPCFAQKHEFSFHSFITTEQVGNVRLWYQKISRVHKNLTIHEYHKPF